MILWVLSPTLMCAIYMWWGNVELRPLLGLAWDCGAVTTGPVTVPVLLALGIGVMKTKREEREAAVRAPKVPFTVFSLCTLGNPPVALN